MIDVLRKSGTLTWPNLLTVLRVFMAVAVIWILLASTTLMAKIVAAMIFAIAAVTDLVDGRLARRTNAITVFGKILDPIADKLLVLGAFVILAYLGMYSIWIVIPIILREVVVTTLRLYFLTKGVAVAAVESGKQKTTVQIAAIAVIYANLMVRTEIAGRLPGQAAGSLGTILDVIMYLLLAVALYQTLYSGAVFFRNNWHLFAR